MENKEAKVVNVGTGSASTSNVEPRLATRDAALASLKTGVEARKTSCW
jgi:hypothetical protein